MDFDLIFTCRIYKWYSTKHSNKWFLSTGSSIDGLDELDQSYVGNNSRSSIENGLYICEWVFVCLWWKISSRSLFSKAGDCDNSWEIQIFLLQAWFSTICTVTIYLERNGALYHLVENHLQQDIILGLPLLVGNYSFSEELWTISSLEQVPEPKPHFLWIRIQIHNIPLTIH